MLMLWISASIHTLKFLSPHLKFKAVFKDVYLASSVLNLLLTNTSLENKCQVNVKL